MFRIKARIRKWKAERKLKKSGYDNWEQYRRVRDPDVSLCSSRIRHFYKGYKYFHCFEDRSHYVYKLLYDYGPGGVRYGDDDMYEWCEKHMMFNYRIDMHRAIKCPATADEWEINELGGGDYWFVAFKRECDYFHFMLRWA